MIRARSNEILGAPRSCRMRFRSLQPHMDWIGVIVKNRLNQAIGAARVIRSPVDFHLCEHKPEQELHAYAETADRKGNF
jgi:hypothetical protein